MTTDAVLNNDKGYYDISWTESGDIYTEQTLATAILASIYEEKRASESEVPESSLRRGWIGNETTPNFEQGSKEWEFHQERVTGTTLADLGGVIRNALQWMINDLIAEQINVETPFLRNGFVCVYINFKRFGSKVDRLFFELWENTTF